MLPSEAAEEAKLRCLPPSSPQTLVPSMGPKSDPTAFSVSRHLKGHGPTPGPCGTDGSDTVLLLIDSSLRLSPDVPATLLNKDCVFFALQSWPYRDGVASGPQTAMRSPLLWALLIP